MSEPSHTRKLVAILAADVTGYSRLMAQDDAGTVRALEGSRAVFRERTEARGGHVIDMAGDSVLAEFPSALEAVHCAIEVQKVLADKNALVPLERRMLFRIGVNIGDILQQPNGTIYGDGVNIAARLESIAEPGGITISGTVYDQVKSRIDASLDFTGEHTVKNIPEPVRAYRVTDAQQGASLSRGRYAFSLLKSLGSGRTRSFTFAALTLLIVAAALAWQFTRSGRQTEDLVLALPKGP